MDLFENLKQQCDWIAENPGVQPTGLFVSMDCAMDILDALAAQRSTFNKTTVADNYGLQAPSNYHEVINGCVCIASMCVGWGSGIVGVYADPRMSRGTWMSKVYVPAKTANVFVSPVNPNAGRAVADASNTAADALARLKTTTTRSAPT